MKPRKFNTLSVGITGGIGSGKTDVCKVFASFGIPIIYADDLANQLIDSSKEIKKEIKKVFTEDVFLADGRLDRKKVASIVFRNQSLKNKLNSIVHPRVLSFIENEINKIKKLGKYPMVVVEAALIYEAKSEKLFDYIIVVDAEEEMRIKRIMQRDNCSREDVINRMKSQMPADIKVSRGDFVIDNSVSKTKLKQRSIFLFNLLKALAQNN